MHQACPSFSEASVDPPFLLVLEQAASRSCNLMLECRRTESGHLRITQVLDATLAFAPFWALSSSARATTSNTAGRLDEWTTTAHGFFGRMA
jgi:hypothetical protein